MSNTSHDLEAWFTSIKNREPEVQIQSRDLADFSESIRMNRLQEDYANGRRKCKNNELQDSGKGLKRKVWATGRNAVSTESRSMRKVEQGGKMVSSSRLAGGTDRHSKVVTAKGLRHRRVRLSVPTAIQLYDLQERLGLEHPNMAVDWLINAAKLAIDELPVREAEKAYAYVGQVPQRTSSNCSIVEHFLGSSRESETAATGSAITAFTVGLGSETAQGANSFMDINTKAITITNMKGPELGSSGSSISDASIKRSAERTSSCSMSDLSSEMEAILKGRELGTRKSAVAKKDFGSQPVIPQLNSMQPSLTSLFKSVFPCTALPFESQCSNDVNPFGIHTRSLSGAVNVQQQLDYTNLQSYTEMLYTHDSHLLQDLDSSSPAPLQKSFLPVPSTPEIIEASIGSFCLESYEMADSAISGFDRYMGRKLEQGQAILSYSNVPNMIVRNVEQQRQKQAQINYQRYASTFLPTLSNDIDLSTASLFTMGPQQSIFSSTTSIPSLSRTHKNNYGEDPANAAHDFVPFQHYEARVLQKFHERRTT